MAATVNISIDQGADFLYLFQVSANGINLLNATAYATMQTEYDDPNTAVAFTCSLVGSNVTITLPASTTAGLTPGTWVYDVLVKDNSGNVVTRCVQGRAFVLPGVTPTP